MLAHEDRKDWNNERSHQLENISTSVEEGRSNPNSWLKELINIKYFNASSDMDMKTSKYIEQLI